MTSCSQNRHATKLRYISKFVLNTILKILEESRIRTYDEINSTNLQSAALNLSAISSYENFFVKLPKPYQYIYYEQG